MASYAHGLRLAVVGVRATVGGVDDACHPAGVLHLDLAAGEIGEHVLGGVEHGGVLRPAGPLGQVRPVVGDQEEGATGSEHGERPLYDGLPVVRRQLEVGEQHEVERPVAGIVGQDVGVHPFHLPGQRTGPLLTHPALVQGDCGEVHGRDAPATSRQPQRVAPLTGGQVHRSSRSEAPQLLLDEAVRPLRPHRGGLGVPAVPVPGVHAPAAGV